MIDESELEIYVDEDIYDNAPRLVVAF